MLTVPEYNINAEQREFAGHKGRVFDVDLGHDGLCCTASEDGTAKVWRLADGRLEGEVAQSASKDEVLRVAWAPRVVREASGASLLAVAGADGFCNLWRGDDWSAPKALQRLDHGGDQVYGCAWSACGDAYGAWLLTAAGAAVRTWDMNAGRSIKQWSYQEPRGDQAYVFDVQPAPRDADDALRATIACAVSDGTARVRDVRLNYDARVLRAPGDSKVTAVGWFAVWKSNFGRPTPSTRYQTTGSSKNAYAPDTHVLARCSANLGQWFGGKIVEGGEDGTCRVVFLDGAKEDVSIANIRVWDRPPLSDWHRKHQGPIKSRYVSDTQSKANTHRSVLQFDLETGNLIAQFVSARRAVDNVPSLTDPQEVLQCCKGAVESAGGYKWTFAAPRPKLDASDVQELIDGNYAIQIQQRNPKKAGTKSALLYDQYKGAESIRDMLALGARRADIPYDISHGWVTLVDPTLQKRFSPPPTAAAPDPPSKEVEVEDEADDDPMDEDDESREDVLKTLPPRPPPARARRGGSVNYADPPDF